MKRIFIVGVVAVVALLGCETTDKGMEDDMEKNMESEQMDNEKEKEDSMENEDSMKS